MFTSSIRQSGITDVTVSSVTDGDHTPDQDHESPRQCTRRGCRRPALDDADYCARCDANIRKYKRDYDRKRRAEWEAAKRCMRCGAKDRKQGRPWCPGCCIRLDAIRKRHRGGRSSDHTVDQDRTPQATKAQRIAARLIAWKDSPQNEGRIRMRGGKRGAPSLEDRDRRDLEELKSWLAVYEHALDEAYGAEYKTMGREQQAATRRALHGGLALVVRKGMEALVSYGYEAPVLVQDPEDEDDEIDDSDEEADT